MKVNTEIVKEILNEVTFYNDVKSKYVVYAEYKKPNGKTYLCDIESEEFQAFLRIEYAYELQEDVELPVRPILRTIHDKALYYEDIQCISVNYRVVGSLKEGIEYFLADSEQRVVQITDKGWEVTTEKVHKFLYREGTLKRDVPMESTTGIFDLLQPFVNISGSNFKLFVIWLIQAFSGGSHYCLFVSAERGSGKSMLTHIINKLLDPSPAETCAMPNNKDDLETFLSSCYLASFDNIDQISKDYSDTFCVSVTGGVVSRRKKFSDSQMVYLPIHNVLVFNGIGIAPSESDLAERSLFFPMKKLTGSELKTEAEIYESFEAVKPQILGCIFETLSKAMAIMDNLKPKKLPRMADAYVEMLAIASVLGISNKDYDEMLNANIKAMDKECATNPLVEAIAEYMTKTGCRKLEGTSTEVFEKIRARYSGKSSLLPPTASMFGKKLKQMEAPLKAMGYHFLIDDTGAKANKITIIKNKNVDKK